MNTPSSLKTMAVAAVFSVAVWFAAPRATNAHCDTLDGPVVSAARLALEKGDVTPVLKWVKQDNEAEIRKAFQKTLAVRNQSQAAKELADTYFFETLVRIHRAGEGAPFTGLKPTGEVEPPITAADKALETGSVNDLAKEIAGAVADGIRKRFARAHAAKQHADHSVEAGREFVEAYVEFVHYVERLHNHAVDASARHHEAESAQSGHKH